MTSFLQTILIINWSWPIGDTFNWRIYTHIHVNNPFQKNEVVRKGLARVGSRQVEVDAQKIVLYHS
jgi:hypothetical protein